MRALREWKCKSCGYSYLCYNEDPTDIAKSICTECFGDMRRVFSFSFHRPMPEHYNHAVGGFVSNRQKLKDNLKQKSEEASERTGIPHDFQPVDYRDKDALGVTDEGLTS